MYKAVRSQTKSKAVDMISKKYCWLLEIGVLVYIVLMDKVHRLPVSRADAVGP